MLYIIYAVGGLLIGLILATFFWVNYIKYITYGTLRQANDDGDTYLFLELDRDPNDIKRLDRVVFNVNKKDFITHQ